MHHRKYIHSSSISILYEDSSYVADTAIEGAIEIHGRNPPWSTPVVLAFQDCAFPHSQSI